MKLTQNHINTIVDLHNELRAKEQAANMQEMIWDPQLAAFAQAGSDACGGHRIAELHGKKYGENIANAWDGRWTSPNPKDMYYV